eukprot:3703014-Karenia_brevis.AAC.1
MSWTLVSKSLARALDYDARLVPSGILLGVASPLSNELDAVVSELAGGSLDECSLRQMRLPGPLGGMGFRRAVDIADAAYWSTWVALKVRVRQYCSAVGRPVTSDVDEDLARDAQQRLESKGLRLTMDGEMNLSAAARE